MPVSTIWTNKQFWMRTGIIGCAVWLGGVTIISAVSRDFRWVPNSYRDSFGPASITALVGMAVICIVCFGVPWIAAATTEGHPGQTNTEARKSPSETIAERERKAPESWRRP
jgi:hypothetical protein